MGLLADLMQWRAAPSGLAQPESWFTDWIGGASTAAGQRVTPDSALGITAVWSAVRIISSAEASLPLILYRRLPGGGKERATDHPLYRLMHDQPNPRQTHYEYFEMKSGHLELRGNAYSVIQHDRRGVVTGLVPLHPDRVVVLIAPDDTLWYQHTSKMGKLTIYREDEILHFRGFSSDGVVGLNPIAVVRESLGTTLAADAHAASFYGNSATPGGVLKTPAKLSKEAYQRLAESWKARHAGSANAWKPAILEEGLDWTTIGMSSRDAQFIENRRFQIEEVARIFDLPPHKLKQLDRATFSNIEHQGLEFLQDALRPRLVRKEERLNAALLLEREREEGYFFEFLVDAIARGDLLTRYNAYAVGRQWGWLSADDVRTRENMNPLPDGAGAEYLNPLNMVPAGAPREAAPPPAPPSASAAPAVEDSDDDDARAVQAFRPLLIDAASRAVRKEVTAARRQATGERSAPDLSGWFAQFWIDHAATLERNLTPLVRTVLDVAGVAQDRDLLAQTVVSGIVVREQEAAGLAFTVAATQGRESLRALLDTWESSRPEQLVARELPRLIATLHTMRGTP